MISYLSIIRISISEEEKKLANYLFTIFKGQDNYIYVEMISGGFIYPNLSIANMIHERISNYVVICETVKK